MHMPKKDINQLAKFLVDQATGEAEPAPELTGRAKAGQQGGLKGGDARAKKLTAQERSEIARLAAQTRWKKSN
jgi:hypothetical protein